jgi:hypothetical protein
MSCISSNHRSRTGVASSRSAQKNKPAVLLMNSEQTDTLKRDKPHALIRTGIKGMNQA